MFIEPMDNFDEIVLPEVESTDTSTDVVVIPLDKYEYMVKEKAKVEILRDYLITSKKPSVAVIKSILGVFYLG